MKLNKKQIIYIIIILAIIIAIYYFGFYDKNKIPENAVICPEKDPNAGCLFEIRDPVCGSDGKTYQTGCIACHYGNAEWWVAGECD